MAYHALARSMEGKPEPELIDGFNWKQRFFLGWAQVWRGNITDERLLQQVKTDPHSPARFRINATVSNLDEFYDRSEEHTSELQSLMRISYAVFCLKKKTTINKTTYLFKQHNNNKNKY